MIGVRRRLLGAGLERDGFSEERLYSEMRLPSMSLS